ncbi:MAG TPA: tetratricopeptide repeat protein [Bryobacteraceae bacterium]|jgi:tetratricopeptide (TPR) repeat protein|nr:tetratricopeptide repeat protein [Bryobacteraceae bacterium]
MSHSLDLRRRSFLIRSLAIPFLPRLDAQDASLQDASLVDGGFHLHPHYRAQTALDATLLKTQTGLDEFITERYHDEIAAILSNWTANLLDSPKKLQAIEKVLAPGFMGSSPQPTESRIVRPGPALEVRRITFSPQLSLGSDAFLQQLRSSFSSFSSFQTAEFQVTQIEVLPGGGLATRVRYELVGAGQGFHREQRVGWWNLEWETSAPDQYRLRNWRPTEETRARSAKPWYDDIAPLAFGSASSYTQQLLRGVDYWRTVLDGASGIDIYGHNGVSAADIDGDGFDDLYVCQPAGLPNRLYRNRGDGTFEDITESSGVGLLENTSCAIFGDFAHAGRQDLIVVRANGPLLFLNQGGGKFLLKPGAFQFANTPQGTFTGAAAADYDRDGWLDIYFCLYAYYQGTDQYKYPTPYYAAENGPPNFMMRNNHDGTFRDVTAQSGLNQNNTRYSFCCGWGDHNRDGWPDLYVVNDFGRKNLYRNNGDGTFTDVAPQAGVEDVGAGMSVCWFDYDNDGAEDLYVADMWTAAGERVSTQKIFQKDAPGHARAMYRKHSMGNSLFRNRGDGAFQDSTALSGTGMGRWSWSSDAWDFDHDGFPDLYIADGMLSGALREDLNGFFWRQVVANSPDTAKPSQDYEQGWNAINELIRADYTWSGYERNVFYVNNRDGTFSDVSGAVDLDFLEDGRAFALADFDHDGRQELFLKNRNAPQLRLLKNVAPELPPAIAFRLRGIRSNPDAIGAAVVVETELGRQTRTLQAGSGFLSQHSKDLFFGLGTAKGPVKASIRWPSGLVQQLNGLPLNRRVWVDEGAEPSRVEPFKKSPSVVSPKPQPTEIVSSTIETWLLTPVPAPVRPLPGGKPILFQLEFDRARQVMNVSADVAAIYNILYRYLFDRHRDLTLPTAFLIDSNGDIVKIYQGPVNAHHVEEDFSRIPQTTEQRLALALPFAGNAETYEFGRNHLSLGSAFFQRGYYDQAEASFRLALRDDPSSAEAHYGLGSVYLKRENLVDARASFEQVLKLTASYPDTGPNAWNNLGLLATREGRISEAIDYFQGALRLNPDYWIALENLGNAYRQQKRWDEARAALERAVAIRPKDPEANYSLAMVYAQMEDTQRAYQYLQNALTLRPAYPEALNNLGILYLRTRRRDDAVARFEECIRVAPGFDQSYLNLARVYGVEGERDKARAVLLDLLKQHPGHAQAQLALDQLR